MSSGFLIKGKYTSAYITIDEIESECSAQIQRFVDHPAFTNKVAIMPGTHAGKGAVIGFTMKMGNKIVPNVVGVDIGCGMLSLNVGNIFKNKNLEKFDRRIRSIIPVGSQTHDGVPLNMVRDFPWERLSQQGL